VQPLREKALFWHNNVKRNEDSIISEKVAQAMLKNNARDF